MKINSDNCSSIAKVGIISIILCTLHRGGEGMIWNSIACQSPQLQVGVLSLWPLESLELSKVIESWEESEALAEVRKV